MRLAIGNWDIGFEDEFPNPQSDVPIAYDESTDDKVTINQQVMVFMSPAHAKVFASLLVKKI